MKIVGEVKKIFVDIFATKIVKRAWGGGDRGQKTPLSHSANSSKHLHPHFFVIISPFN